MCVVWYNIDTEKGVEKWIVLIVLTGIKAQPMNSQLAKLDYVMNQLRVNKRTKKGKMKNESNRYY